MDMHFRHSFCYLHAFLLPVAKCVARVRKCGITVHITLLPIKLGNRMSIKMQRPQLE